MKNGEGKKTKQWSPWQKLEIQSYFAAIICTRNFTVTYQKLDLVSDWEIEIAGSSGLQFIHRSGRVQQTRQPSLQFSSS